MPDHIPLTEYLYHRPFVMQIPCIDLEERGQEENAVAALARALDYETKIPWRSHHPFSSANEVLAFNPLDAVDLPGHGKLTASVRQYEGRTGPIRLRGLSWWRLQCRLHVEHHHFRLSTPHVDFSNPVEHEQRWAGHVTDVD